MLGESKRNQTIFAYQKLCLLFLRDPTGVIYSLRVKPGWVLGRAARLLRFAMETKGLGVSFQFWSWHGLVQLFVRTESMHDLVTDTPFP